MGILNIFFGNKKKEKLPPTNNHRMLFQRPGCPHCKLYLGVIEEINIFLNPEKRIRIIDVTEEWDLGVKTEEIASYLDIKGTPTLYLGGKNPVVLEGVTTRPYLKGFLKGYFERLGEL
mgnify:CR=1 FL=1